MSFNGQLLATGGVAQCLTDSVQVFGGSSGAALYTLDYDASDAGGLYDGTPSNLTFGVGGQINTAARFNGSNSSISIADGGIGNNATARVTFSISLWVKFSNSKQQVFVTDYVNSGKYSFYIQAETNGQLSIGNNYTGGLNYVTGGTTAINDGNWHHLVLVNNTSTNTQKLYLDGNTTPVHNITLGTGTKAAKPIQVGEYIDLSGTYNFLGSIDQVRFFTSALTESQMDTLYTETACVYTCTTDTVNYPTTNLAYYKLDNSADDETGVYDGTSTNVTYTFGRFGQAAVFNGTSRIEVSNASKPSLSTTTVSFWLKTTQTSIQALIGEGYSSNYWGNLQIYLYLNKLSVLSGNASNAENSLYSSTSNVNTGLWVHCAVTMSGNTSQIFINGTLETTQTLTVTRAATTNPFTIGQMYTNGNPTGVWLPDCSIDQVRIFNTALSESQVTELYNEKPCADTSNFKAVLYEGASSYVSNVGFQPDLLWVKGRTFTSNNRLFDVVRTASAGSLSSNQTAGNATASGQIITSFEANGFIAPLQAGDVNQSGQDFVAWNWKGGGDAVLNEVGDIDSQVSANTEAGFSIVKYTGNGISASLQKVGTGLDQECDIVFIKNLDSAASWVVQRNKTDVNKYLYLNDTRAESTSTAFKVDINTNEGTFGFTSNNAGVNALNNTYIAYCWHSVSGYSKIGTYAGTGATHILYTTDDGTSGGSNPFQPSFLIIKRTDSSDAWQIYDNKRGVTEQLMAQSADAEYTQDGTSLISFNSNGFTLGIDNSARVNAASPAQYLYIAFK